MSKREIRIVVASPGDVQAERDLLREVIADLDRSLGDLLNVTLRPVMWETDAFPGFHAEGPQGLIDSVLRIDQCDLLLGIFWKRFGTPVHDAGSGTEHEFRIAYDNWKLSGKPQIMMYFNTKPFMALSEIENEQFGKVIRFKRDFPKEGCWWSYSGKQSFAKLARTHITEQLKRISTPASTTSSPKAKSSQKAKRTQKKN